MDSSKKLNLYRSVAGRLVDEPLFHMSLGSKELFHSNLLGFLYQSFPSLIDATFGGLRTQNETCKERRIQREKSKLDLVIETQGYDPIVIENKVFSLPDESQLDRYAAEGILGLQGDPVLVLLSLADPVWKDGLYATPNGSQWRYMSYETVATSLGREVDTIRRADSFIGDVASHYVRLLDQLVCLSDLVKVGDDDEPLELDPEAVEALRPVRIHDASRKLRASHVIREMRRRANWGPEVWAQSDFSNGSTLLQAFVRLTPKQWIGWQYQMGQFRLAMILEDLSGRTAESQSARAAFAQQHQQWFDFSQFHLVLGTSDETTIPRRARVGADGFYHFAPTFIHRYRVPPALTVGQLMRLGLRYIALAQEFAEEFGRGQGEKSSSRAAP